ncbi:MAG: ferrous iron transport protein B [Anaerolineaceae bacterium]|nr:ferrous iron transport protein B [Anaerolineaceae bacterium]
MEQQRIITVALAGQPNTGKSTVFNVLTGLKQHVGNWPGKTVEQKTGFITCNGSHYRLVDLPGTYSLTANSPEELIARDFIIEEQPDVVVVVTDAAQLERNLYLVTELLPLSAPVIIALNMMDVAEQEGRPVDPIALAEATGIRVVPMVAAKNQGVKELLAVVHDLVHDGVEYAPSKLEVQEDHRALLDDVLAQITGHVPAPYPVVWVALKLIEGDRVVIDMMKENLIPVGWAKVESLLREHDDAQLAVAGGRYEWIERATRVAIKRHKADAITRTRRFDRIATHPVWGVFTMLSILIVAIVAAMAIGMPISMGIMNGVNKLVPIVTSLLVNAPSWISSLVVEGILFGVMAVLALLGFLIVCFTMFGLLEDIGYMARVAYVMDRAMGRIGLHGRSFLPLLMGFICTIPAVVGTRVIESERARLKAILLMPFVPCMAMTMTLMFYAPIFFTPGSAVLVVLGMILGALVLMALTGILLDRVVLPGERVGFIMELPLYHRPNFRTVGTYVWQSARQFLRMAGTVIIAVAVGIWALSYLPNGDIETSILATIGHALSPLGNLMGLDWRMLVALFSSFISKEAALASLAVMLGATDTEAGLATALQAVITPAAALGYLTTQTLFIPCIGTLGVIIQESRSWKWALAIVGYLLIIAFGMGILVYQVARLVI